MKVLFIGESWFVHMIHAKGYDTFESTQYDEGANFLIDGLREEGIDIDYMPAHEVQIRFPNNLESLKEYDSIIISDIGSNTFLLQNKTFYDGEVVPNSLDLIAEYVRQGGGLLMIGGYLSFMGIEGKANYKNTILSEVLPVNMLDGDDRVETPAGIKPQTVTSDLIINNITEWPTFLGYNRFTAKKGSKVLATIGKDPFIVLGKYREGNTAAFASDCAPHWGSDEFLQWDQYLPLWKGILKYISRK